MQKPIAHMTPAELAALSPGQMVETILHDNHASLSRGMALNLSRDILDCLRTYGAACVQQERERCAQLLCRDCREGRSFADEVYHELISGRLRKCEASAIRANPNEPGAEPGG